jgi:hypothetical protein
MKVVVWPSLVGISIRWSIMAAFLVGLRGLARDARGTIARKCRPDKPQAVMQDGRT